MLIIFNDIMDGAACDTLIAEFERNPNKRVLNPDIDDYFDNRVLYLQRMSSDVQYVVSRMTLQVTSVVGRHFQTTLFAETVSMVRWDDGDSMLIHRDGQNPHTSNRSHTAIIYLNDQDDGGEIVFPTLGTTIMPRRAMMLAYDKRVLHGVNTVHSPRYTLTIWMSEERSASLFVDERTT
jgi:hypothetical protein